MKIMTTITDKICTMDTVQVNTESIAAYKEIVMEPQKHGFDFRPFDQCFEKSDRITAKHILANEYLTYLGKPLPKLILYIIMDQVFGLCDGKDEKGNLGYHLTFLPINP